MNVYQESWKCEWKPIRSTRLVEVDAVDKLSDLQPASWYKNGHVVYVIDEKKLYKAKHKKVIEYIGVQAETE